MNDPRKSDHYSETLRACQLWESLLLCNLRRLLDQPKSVATSQSLLETLEYLLFNASRHLALACEGAYMSEVLGERPNWHRQIESLHAANQSCISSLGDLYDRMVHASRTATAAKKDSRDLKSWMHALESIRRHECRMLQRAFTLDVGGEA